MANSARSSDGVALTWICRLLPRVAATRRDEQFALECVEYHCKLEPSATLVRDRDAELRKAMRKVDLREKRDAPQGLIHTSELEAAEADVRSPG